MLSVDPTMGSKKRSVFEELNQVAKRQATMNPEYQAAAEAARCVIEEAIDTSWASSKGVSFPWQLSIDGLGGDVFKVAVSSLCMSYAFVRQKVAIQAGKDVRQVSLSFENEQLPEKGTLQNLSDVLDGNSRLQVVFTKIVVSEKMGKRIKNELKDFEADLPRGTTIELLDSEIYDGPSERWKVVLAGPADTPYEGGTFTLMVKLPLDYPFKPPHFHFTTKIWNPHINPQTGGIEIDIFHDAWSSALTVAKCVLCILSLLNDPGVAGDFGVNWDAARQLREDKAAFENKAREWTHQYALGVSPG